MPQWTIFVEIVGVASVFFVLLFFCFLIYFDSSLLGVYLLFRRNYKIVQLESV